MTEREIPPPRDDSKGGKAGKPNPDLANANQHGRVESTEHVSSAFPAAEALLGKEGARRAEALLRAGRDLLAKVGIGTNPATDQPDELTGPPQVRSLIQSGYHPLFAQQREAELKATLASGDKDRISAILARNGREHGHFLGATELIQADLRKAQSNLEQA
jgi:hypothetical protein